MPDLRYVVKVSLEGYMIQSWLAAPICGHRATNDLDEAAVFQTIAEAHAAIGASGLLAETWLLGYEVIYRGLCRHNPC